MTQAQGVTIPGMDSENWVVVTTQLEPLDSQEILVVSESAILMKRGDSFIKKEGSSFYKYYIRKGSFKKKNAK